MPPAQPRAARYRRRSTTDLPSYGDAGDTGVTTGTTNILTPRETRCPTEQHVIKNRFLRYLFLAALILLPIAGIYLGGGPVNRKAVKRPRGQQQHLPGRLFHVKKQLNPERTKQDPQNRDKKVRTDEADRKELRREMMRRPASGRRGR